MRIGKDAVEGLIRNHSDPKEEAIGERLREMLQEGPSDVLGLDGCGLTKLPEELW
jgi:hypothetical protein